MLFLVRFGLVRLWLIWVPMVLALSGSSLRLVLQHVFIFVRGLRRFRVEVSLMVTGFTG